MNFWRMFFRESLPENEIVKMSSDTILGIVRAGLLLRSEQVSKAWIFLTHLFLLSSSLSPLSRRVFDLIVFVHTSRFRSFLVHILIKPARCRVMTNRSSQYLSIDVDVDMWRWRGRLISPKWKDAKVFQLAILKKKMLLLVSDGTMSLIMQTHAILNARNPVIDIDIVGEANNIVSSLMDANSLPLTPTRVVGIIDIVNSGELLRRSNDWMSSSPKKKWIRHYLLGKSSSCASKNGYFIII